MTDYCNSLLANSSQHALNRLQQAMNAAVRLVCHSGRQAPMSGLLRDRLHWLCIPERVKYKLSSSFQSCSWHLTKLSKLSSADQTPRTLLVLNSTRQHTAISRFHVQIPTLVIMHLQSLSQCHGTDDQQQSGHLTLCSFKTQLKAHFLTDSSFFAIHLACRCP